MMTTPANTFGAPQKEEDSITKKNDELQEGELNKVTGGIRKAGGDKVVYLQYG
jgi:hypothetical protein